MTKVTLDLPDEVFSALRRSPEEFDAELRLLAPSTGMSEGLCLKKRRRASQDWTALFPNGSCTRKCGYILCRHWRTAQGIESWLNDRPAMLPLSPSSPAETYLISRSCWVMNELSNAVVVKSLSLLLSPNA